MLATAGWNNVFVCPQPLCSIPRTPPSADYAAAPSADDNNDGASLKSVAHTIPEGNTITVIPDMTLVLVEYGWKQGDGDKRPAWNNSQNMVIRYQGHPVLLENKRNGSRNANNWVSGEDALEKVEEAAADVLVQARVFFKKFKWQRYMVVIAAGGPWWSCALVWRHQLDDMSDDDLERHASVRLEEQFWAQSNAGDESDDMSGIEEDDQPVGSDNDKPAIEDKDELDIIGREDDPLRGLKMSKPFCPIRHIEHANSDAGVGGIVAFLEEIKDDFFKGI